MKKLLFANGRILAKAGHNTSAIPEGTKTCCHLIRLLLVFLLIARQAFYTLYAQDATLPQSSSLIYLRSGKEIKNARLWKIDTLKVQYVADGNLGDVRTPDVNKIETPLYLITFDEKNNMLKKHYDFILPNHEDTIWCIIQKVDEWAILYQLAGSDTKKSIMKGSVKTYLQWPEEKSEKPETVPVINKTAAATDSVNKEKKNIPSQTGQDDYFVSRKKAEEDVAKWEGNQPEAYYHQSYQRGVSDAVWNYKGAWGTGGFCTGCLGISPFLSLAAINSKIKLDKIPSGVDKKLYRDGYENQITKMRSHKTAKGASIAVGIISAIYVLVLLVSL